MRWSAGAVIGRQLSQLVCALLLARLLGPQTYGVLSVATVYVTLTSLMVDQGLAVAFVQRSQVKRTLAGAIATANLLSALVLAGLTWVVAPLVASFFSVETLTPLLRVLGLGLLLKAAAISPRAVRQRALRFKIGAVAEISGGVLGAVAGISAALSGAGIWSLAWQVLVTDAVIAVVLLALTRGTRPNLALADLAEILPFSLRVFSSSALAFCSRNADNVLVGRVLGVPALSHYAMAYRVLVIPVQMIGQTVNRVAFPTFARLSHDAPLLAKNLTKVTELLAFTAVLPMGLVGVAAPELVAVALGPAWALTAPILSVLALAGARETVFIVTGSLMRAKGQGRLIFRYEIGATIAQLTGIVVGLQFGLVGVAFGLAAAGVLLTPVLLLIQRRLAGVSVRAQLRSILPPVHAGLWGAGGYLLLREIGWGDLGTALAGGAAYLTLAFAVLALVHRAFLRRCLGASVDILGIRSGRRQPQHTARGRE